MRRKVTYSDRPSLRVERSHLAAGCRLVAGMDEVGRGALAGPVTIGVTVVDAGTRTAPTGLKDSKLLAPPVREQLAPRVRRWAVDHAVGHASAAEIDELGIMAALRLAGLRALAALRQAPDVVILDGNHNYLASPKLAGESPIPPEAPVVPRVVTLIRGDMRCSSVAAASILAKTTRDAAMVEWAREHPGYAWEVNKGYSAPAHLEALRRRGPSPLHRTSWRLPCREERRADLDETPAATVNPKAGQEAG